MNSVFGHTVSVAIALIGFPAGAATLDFSFTFENALNGGGTVTGIVRGLEDNTADQEAESLEILSNTAGFGVGTYQNSCPITNLDPWGCNSWTVVDGEIVDFFFYAENFDPYVQLMLNSYEFYGRMAGMSDSFTLVTSSASVSSEDMGLTFSRIDGVVPLPASFTFLLLGSAALAGISLRSRARTHSSKGMAI